MATNAIYYEDSNIFNMMSDKVQTMAGSVYKEFENIIKTYGDEAIKNLIPLIINILENLDQSYKIKIDQDIEKELTKVEIEHLILQLEREKNLRKSSDLKYLEIEDSAEEAKKKTNKIKDNLESKIYRLEIKNKNLFDQVKRYEEKENEMKIEYSKIHTRYTELVKLHADLVYNGKNVNHNLEILKIKNNCCNFDKIDIEKMNENNFYENNLKNISCDNNEFKKGKNNNETFYLSYNNSESHSNKNNNCENIANLLTVAKNNLIEKNIDNKIISSYNSTTCKNSTYQSFINDFINNNKNNMPYSEYSAVYSNIEIHTHNTSVVSSHNTTNNNILDYSIDKNHITSPLDDIHLKESNENKMNKEFSNYSKDEQITALSYSDSIEESWLDDQGPVDELYGECVMASNSASLRPLKVSDNDHISSEDENIEYDFPLQNIQKTNLIENQLPSIYDHIYENKENFVERHNTSIYEELCEIGPSDFSSVTTEIENLLKENTELLSTKNALNILKDDLIFEMDELSGELEVSRKKFENLNITKQKFESRNIELEEELKQVKDDNIKLKVELEKSKKHKSDGFSRIDMVRLVMERNQFKEKLIELQEAVRWAETVRASRAHPELVGELEEKQKENLNNNNTKTAWSFISSLSSYIP